MKTDRDLSVFNYVGIQGEDKGDDKKAAPVKGYNSPLPPPYPVVNGIPAWKAPKVHGEK